MKKIYEDTLKLINYSLYRNKSLHLDLIKEINKEDYWIKLYKICEAHKIIPIVYEAIYNIPDFINSDEKLKSFWKMRSIAITINQIKKTERFLNIYEKLINENIKPLVFKGIICRELYPKPDQRISSDEDMLIKKDEFEKCNKILISCGLVNVTENEDDFVQSYHCKKTGLHLEIHKQLFSEDYETNLSFNTIFQDVFENSVSLKVNNLEVETFSYNQHLLYLICHSAKHFQASGFGIRQLCDLVMYINHYGKNINWKYIWSNLNSLNLKIFMLNLINIGERYLGLDNRNIVYDIELNKYNFQSENLLEDIMEAGIYGTSSHNRQHSALITLGAINNEKSKKRFGTASLNAIFPNIRSINNKYVYLRKYPILLPIAWGQRIISYIRSNRQIKNSAKETINIGNKRIELLKKYKLIS